MNLKEESGLSGVPTTNHGDIPSVEYQRKLNAVINKRIHKWLSAGNTTSLYGLMHPDALVVKGGGNMKNNKKRFYREFNKLPFEDKRCFVDWLCDELTKARTTGIQQRHQETE